MEVAGPLARDLLQADHGVLLRLLFEESLHSFKSRRRVQVLLGALDEVARLAELRRQDVVRRDPQVLARGAVRAFALTRHERGAAQRHRFDPPRANRADAQGGEAARPAGEQQHYE